MLPLKIYYQQIIRHNLLTKFYYKNNSFIPEIKQIVINMGLGKIKKNYIKILLHLLILRELTKQRPIILKSKKSIVGFKLRKGSPIGIKVTLRKNNIFNFLDEFSNFIIPNSTKLELLNTKSFDNNGNFSFSCDNVMLYTNVVNNFEETFFINNFIQNKGFEISIKVNSKNSLQTFFLLNNFNLNINEYK